MQVVKEQKLSTNLLRAIVIEQFYQVPVRK